MPAASPVTRKPTVGLKRPPFHPAEDSARPTIGINSLRAMAPTHPPLFPASDEPVPAPRHPTAPSAPPPPPPPQSMIDRALSVRRKFTRANSSSTVTSAWSAGLPSRASEITCCSKVKCRALALFEEISLLHAGGVITLRRERDHALTMLACSAAKFGETLCGLGPGRRYRISLADIGHKPEEEATSVCAKA